MNDSRLIFILIFPLIWLWASTLQASFVFRGRRLEVWEMELARKVGVSYPQKIKVLMVEQLPFPNMPGVGKLAAVHGMNRSGGIGLTLGHCIFIRNGFYSMRLASHEMRHVQQYESAGSTGALLSRYIKELMAYGYRNAPLEVDARAHEISNIRSGNRSLE